MLGSLPVSETLHDRVLATIRRFAMLEAADSVLVGVSGGPDSVALLHLLMDLRERLPLRISVAHLAHRIRAEASDADRAFVEDMARRLGLPCAVGREDVAALARAEKRSIEDAGRAARRRF